MARKKKKPVQPQQPLSPKKYILTRARLLPVYKCLVNENWEKSKLASVIVTRKHSTGNITAGFFLVDLMARGVKDTHYVFNEREVDFFDNLYERWPMHPEEIPYPLAHNIIYGALEFAEDYNFKPHPDFDITSHILEEDTEEIELMDLEFGVNGKPFIMDGIPLDDFENVDEDIEGEDFDDHALTPDFGKWNDDDWRAFFSSAEKPPAMTLLRAFLELFDRWFNEHYASSLTDHPAATSLEDLEITYDDIDPYYFQNQKLPEETRKIVQELSSASGNDELERVKTKLHKLVARNPQNPVYHNYLALCFGALGDHLALRETVEKMVKEFPDYPFSKMAFANVLMDEGNMEAAEKLFTNRYTLPVLYPGRKIFHISELIAFNSTMMRLFLHKGDIEAVSVYYDTMSLLDEYDHMDGSAICVKVSEQFLRKKTEIALQYIHEKGYDVNSKTGATPT